MSRANAPSRAHVPRASRAARVTRAARVPRVPRATGVGRARRGFTLIEAISTLLIVATLGVVSSGAIYRAARSFSGGAVQAQLSSEASSALDVIVRELQGIAAYDASGTIAPQITSVSPTAIVYSTNSTISYDGSTVWLTLSGGTARALIQNVSAFSISAFDQSNGALSSTLSGVGVLPVRRLSVSLTVSRFGESETLRTRVFLRAMAHGVGL